MSNLQTLDLSGNNLSELPTEMSKLVNLKRLSLDGNANLKKIPDEIKRLTNHSPVEASYEPDTNHINVWLIVAILGYIIVEWIISPLLFP